MISLLDHLIDEDRDRLIDGDEHSVFILTQADVNEIVHSIGGGWRAPSPHEQSSYHDQLLGRPVYIVERYVPKSVLAGAIYSPRAAAALAKTSVDAAPPQS